MSLDPFILGVVFIVAVAVLIHAITNEHKKRADAKAQEFLRCFMRDLEAGRYERK